MHGKTKWSDSETKFIILIYYNITWRQILFISRSSLYSPHFHFFSKSAGVWNEHLPPVWYQTTPTEKQQHRLINEQLLSLQLLSQKCVNQKTNWQTFNLWPLCILHVNLSCFSMLLLKYLFHVRIFLLFSNPPWVCPSESCLLIS